MTEKFKHSLLARTILALVVAVLIFISATTAVLFWNAREEAYADQDLALYDVAAALARADVSTVLPNALTMDPKRFAERMESAEPLPAQSEMHGMHRGMMGMGMRHRMRLRMHEDEHESAGYEDGPMCAWNADAGSSARRTVIAAGEPVLVRLLSRQGQGVQAVFPEDLREGFTTTELLGAPHRLCLLFLPDGRYTAVAEPVQLQEAVVEERALAAITPLLIFAPLLALLLAATLWRAFRPLNRAAKEAGARGAADLTPLTSDGVPSEVMPLVEAVNGLLARVAAARTREIRFTADAAHELRSPLTSLTIEAEHLARMDLPQEARTIVESLESGLSRAVHQVSQLLLFARAQAGESREALLRDAHPWHASELVGELIEPLLKTLEQKHGSFEAEGLDAPEMDEPIAGLSRTAAGAILRNLLENAVRYSPEGGRIVLTAKKTADALECTVVDDGPGIPEAERKRVFDPFYRILGTKVSGTGLGLAIVKTYADMIGAEVTLDYARSSDAADKARIGRGLAAHVRFPLHPAAPSGAPEADAGSAA